MVMHKSKKVAAQGIKKMAENMEAYLNSHEDYKNIVDSETLSHLETALEDIKRQAEEALVEYDVYGISTPFNSRYGVGSIYLYGSAYLTQNEAETAAINALSAHGSFGMSKPRWTFFVSDEKLETDL